MSKGNTLGKTERLKSRKVIEQLFKEGRSLMVPPFRVYYTFLPANEDSTSTSSLAFGAGVSSRHFKKAVDRNRVKRLIRENWRVQKNDLRSLLITLDKKMAVFVIYTGKEMPAFTDTKTKIATVIKKLTALPECK